MLGEQIGELRGKILSKRVLSSDPLRLEVTVEDSGKILGVEVTSDIGTYISQVRPDGGMYDEGEGYFRTGDGETVVWKGSGLGKVKEGGAVSYRGIIYHKTASQKLARLNTTPVVFEYEVDPKEETTTKLWEWK
jgi:hypothetical protein